VLAYLTRQPGRLVTKDELREQVWGTIHVSDATLRVTVREIRAALGDDQTSRQHVETVPGRGYRFVPDPDASLGFESAGGQGAERPAVDPGELIVGRQQEIEYLLNRFLEADSGQRQLVFVAGEPGAGKTTLVKLFMERLTGRPGTTLMDGRCVMSFGAGEAYGPVLEALGRLAAEPKGNALVRLLDHCAPMWLVQLPAVVESGELERLQHRVEGATRERMVRELNDVLERLTTKATLVLALEDLHWSDVSTVELLTSVAQRPEPARLLILATYRPADAVVSAPALREAIRELQGRGLCEHLDLELLTRRQVGAYVAARLGDAASEDVADCVFQRSGGNALFMVNVFDHLLQAQVIRKLDDGWIVEGAAAALSEVPVGLRPFIRRRLDTLSAEERRTLEIASVAGVEFDAAALLLGTSPAELKQDLERLEPTLEALAARSPLIEAGGVTEWPDGTLSAHYRFRHALYREVLYQEISEARRVRLHRMIGEHLRAAFGPEDASLAAVLAVHFENGRDAENTARYRRMAGERALGRHAYREAAEHLEKALGAFDQARSRRADGDPEDRVRWELEVCTTLAWTLSATRGYSHPETTRINSRARSLLECLDDPTVQFPALFNLWSDSNAAADHAEATNLITLMSELAAGTGNDELAMMYSSAKARTQFYLGDLAGCAEHIRRILTPHDPRRLADVHGRYGQVEHAIACLGVNAWILWLQGYPDQALAEMRETLKLAERLEGPHTDALAGYLALGTLHFCGDTAQLDRRVTNLKRLCAEQGYALWLAWATCFEGWVAGARGNLDEGIALMECGVGGLRDTGARAHLPHLLALLADLCLRAGRIEAASERLAEARAQADSSGERYWEAELHRLDGEVLLASADNGGRDGDRGDRAEACFQSALEVARRQQARSLELRAALSLSRLWSRSRRDEARRLLGGVLETFSEGHDTADLRAASEQMAQLAHGLSRKAP
jgi:predicted ATPase